MLAGGQTSAWICGFGFRVQGLSKEVSVPVRRRFAIDAVLMTQCHAIAVPFVQASVLCGGPEVWTHSGAPFPLYIVFISGLIPRDSRDLAWGCRQGLSSLMGLIPANCSAEQALPIVQTALWRGNAVGWVTKLPDGTEEPITVRCWFAWVAISELGIIVAVVRCACSLIRLDCRSCGFMVATWSREVP